MSASTLDALFPAGALPATLGPLRRASLCRVVMVAAALAFLFAIVLWF
jgi:hypothetical protein